MRLILCVLRLLPKEYGGASGVLEFMLHPALESHATQGGSPSAAELEKIGV